MRLIDTSIEKVPNDKIEEALILNPAHIPEVYRIGVIEDSGDYYGIFIDRKSHKTYALKYIVKYDKAFVSGVKTIAADIKDEAEWNMISDAINKYNLIANFQIYEKRLLLQWYQTFNNKAYIRKDLYEHRYNSIKDSGRLPNGVQVVTYTDEEDYLKKLDEDIPNG